MESYEDLSYYTITRCLKCRIYGRASLGAWGENGDVRCKHKERNTSP